MSTKRHVAITFTKRFVTLVRSGAESLFPSAYLTGSRNDPIDTQASHSTSVAFNHYAKEFLNGATATPIYHAYRHGSRL